MAQASRGRSGAKTSYRERGSVSRGGNTGQSEDYGDAINGYDVCTDVLATLVPEANSRGTWGDARKLSTLSDVARGDFKTTGWMITSDSLRDGVMAMKRIVGHLKARRRQRGVVGTIPSARSKKSKSLHIGRGVGNIVHAAFVETGMRSGLDKGTG